MNIPISTQKVVVYKKEQESGLVIKMEVIQRENNTYPPVELMKKIKNDDRITIV